MAVFGTGDEGSVLIGALNPAFVEVAAVADIRPFNVYRAFHGDASSETVLAVRPGLIAKYGWRTEDEARRHVKVYQHYEDLLEAEKDIEAVIIALPLHLHAPAAIAAMQRASTCSPKSSWPTASTSARTWRGRQADRQNPGRRAPAALQHPLRQRGRRDPPRVDRRGTPHPRPVASRRPARPR